jgi:hypothetical protein
MHSHLHLLCKATNGFILSDVMRDFKKNIPLRNYSDYIEEPESRREFFWLILKKRVLILKEIKVIKHASPINLQARVARRLSR